MRNLLLFLVFFSTIPATFIRPHIGILVWACGFGALRRDRKGQVHIDFDACTGCGLCEPACPYGTIHMQALVKDGEAEVVATPVQKFLTGIGLGSLVLPKKKVEPEKEAVEEPGKTKSRKRLAVKCDLCAGRGDMACIYNCPCGAIERIDPDILLSTS